MKGGQYGTVRKGTILDSDYLGSNPGSASCLTQNMIFNLLGPSVCSSTKWANSGTFLVQPAPGQWVLLSCVALASQDSDTVEAKGGSAQACAVKPFKGQDGTPQGHSLSSTLALLGQGG